MKLLIKLNMQIIIVKLLVIFSLLITFIDDNEVKPEWNYLRNYTKGKRMRKIRYTLLVILTSILLVV